MADDPQDPSGLVDMARSVWKKGNDLVNKIPTPGYKPDQPSQTVQDLNKQMNDKSVQDANKSYIHDTQTAAQKKSAPAPTASKTVTKTTPRKR